LSFVSLVATSGATFPCTNCGANLHYDASTRAMKCPFCGFQQATQQPAAAPRMEGGTGGGPREIPIEEGFRLAQRGYGTPVKEVECKDCGATVNVAPNEQAIRCAFCGSQQVLPRESAGTQIRPESLVPFRVDKAAANANFGKWIKGLWFRPSDLAKMATLQEIGGIYIPFWTFDATARSYWRAESGYYYYEKEEYTDNEGNRQTREVQKTRWEPASGSRTDAYDDTIVCASKGIPEELVDKFGTWNTKELTVYDPQFLAGWKAESYAIDLMPAWQKGQEKMEREQYGRCRSDVPGDTHRGLEVDTTFSRVTFKHVLLPVWLAAYRYQNKPYQFLVNGQTGEVVGKAPWSWIKITLFVLLIIAIIVGVVILAQRGKQRRTDVGARSDRVVAIASQPARRLLATDAR
jgi:DNA-directed RNA polymerase subunit RPC12/RpoP